MEALGVGTQGGGLELDEGGLELLDAAGDQDHVGAFGGDEAGGGAAHAIGGSGDQDSLYKEMGFLIRTFRNI